MKELLEKLKSLDPTTYESIANHLAWAEVQWEELYPEYKGDKPYIPEDAAISTPMEYLIQGVLQDAISDKGWAMVMTYNPPSGPEGMFWDVMIWTSWNVWFKEDKCYAGKADSPVESLLAAYIAACEVTP